MHPDDATPPPPTRPTDRPERPARWPSGAAHLAWVCRATRLVHVTAIDGPPAMARARVTCPRCRGAVRVQADAAGVRYATHPWPSPCTLASDADAVARANTALALTAAFRRATQDRTQATTPRRAAELPAPRLLVRERCPGVISRADAGRRVRCAAVHDTVWCAGWDEVLLDLGDGNAPPVLLLRSAGRPVAHITIHRDRDDPSRLNSTTPALGLPRIAVASHPAFNDARRRWTTDRPLRITRRSDAVAWRCALHRPRTSGSPRRVADGFHPWLARAVDRLGPTGRWARDVVYMEAEVRCGVVVAMRLVHTADDDVIAKVRPTSRLETARALHAAFRRWAVQWRRRGERLDSPMPWTAARYLRQHGPSLALSPRVAPLRWRFDPARSAWRRRVGVADGGWVVGPGRSARRPVDAAGQ